MERTGSQGDTGAWRDLSASERNGMLVRAEWSEGGLIALAETLSWDEIEILLNLYDGEVMPRWARLTKREVKGLLLRLQQSDCGVGKFDCAICGQCYDSEESGVMTLEHGVPKADLVFNNLQNHLLTCQACNRLRGDRYTITGARAMLASGRHGRDVNMGAALWAVQRVQRMVILIMRLEPLYAAWLRPNLARLEARR